MTPCGGDITGTWTVTSSCLTVTGGLDLASFGAGCATAPVTGSLGVTGTWTANADGTYTDNTTTSGDEQFTLAPSCLVISSTPVTCKGAGGLLTSLGYSSVTCVDAAGGGCTCSATVQQNGGLGIGVAGTVNERQLHERWQPADAFGRCGRYEVLVLRLGKYRNHDAPERQSNHDRQHRAPEERQFGCRRRDGGERRTDRSGRRWARAELPAAREGRGRRRRWWRRWQERRGRGRRLARQHRSLRHLQDGGNPCVAAHSTVSALFGAYGGKLYQVRNSAGATKDILALSPGGFADGPSQDTFCTGTTCVITVVYDQSGKGNDLWYQGSTMVPASTSSTPSKATTESLTLSGHKVYSLYINPGNSYWVDASKSGIPLGSQPEGMYMVTSGKHFNSGCCFDYGNSETDRKADGPGAMDAINFSTITAWGTGAGAGPWVMADLEFGVFAQNNTNKNQNDPAQTQHVRHRRAEEQRDDGVRAQRRQRGVRQLEHVLQRRAARRDGAR